MHLRCSSSFSSQVIGVVLPMMIGEIIGMAGLIGTVEFEMGAVCRIHFLYESQFNDIT